MSKELLLKIGKAKNNDEVIDNPFISDYHLELFVDETNHIFLTDLKSIGGTFVNGSKLSGFVELKRGDEVFIGNGYCLDWEGIIENHLKNKRTKNLNIKKIQEGQKSISSNWVQSNLDLILIYGLILFFILYFFIML